MRGIPDNLATREDVYNAAMGLPPEQAQVFLDGLMPDKVKGLLNAEELAILKANVAVARGLAQSKEARLAQKHTELEQAESHLVDLKDGRSRLEGQLKDGVGEIEDVKANLLKLNEPMNDRRSELQEKINAEKNLLPTLDKHLNDLADQVKALAAKKATVGEGIRELEQHLDTHEKDLQVGHSAATKKKIEMAEEKLAKCHRQQAEATDALIGCNAEEKSTSDLIANLKGQIGDLNNG